jgi:hypothetical protein
LLERHALSEAVFADVNAHLTERGITLRSGTLMDATIIDAPSSTKNKARAYNGFSRSRITTVAPNCASASYAPTGLAPVSPDTQAVTV